MDAATLTSMMDFARARLVGTLDAIEKSGQNVHDVLLWRPGKGRAHMAWQAMHCAASHDRYYHTVALGLPNPSDPALVTAYAGGSTPSDTDPADLARIRATLQKHLTPFREFVSTRTPEQLDEMIGPPDRRRKLGEAVVLLAWHESHHQGQMHLTWNLYKAAHGIK